MRKSVFGVALCLLVFNVNAAVIQMTANAFFTLINPDGSVTSNPDAQGVEGGDFFGIRSPLSGMTVSYDTVTGIGSASIDSIMFTGDELTFNNIELRSIGNGYGGNGPLILSTVQYGWPGWIGAYAYLISDATGFFNAIDNGIKAGDIISDGSISSTDSAIIGQFPQVVIDNVGLLGGIPFAMTTLDVNYDGIENNFCGTSGGSGVLINGGSPVCDDGISGTGAGYGPFALGGYGFSIDVTEMTVTSVVPIPSAVWLFGSGLIGLIGMARRKA